MGKEIGQRLGRHEFRFAIDGAAKDFQRNAAPQHLLGGGGIHRDGGAGLIQQLCEFAAAHVVDAGGHAVLAGQIKDDPLQRRAPGFQRMRLEHQMVMLRRPPCKAFDHQRQELGHRGKRRVHPETGVMFQLQQRQMIGKAAIFDPRGGHDPVKRQIGHQQQPLGIQHGFHGQRQIAVPPEMPVVAIPEQHEPMIQGPIKHMLAHVPPMRGRFGHVDVGQFQRPLHLGHGHLHQAGIAVRSAAFIGDPIGPHVPLFEHMHGDPGGAGGCHGLRMDRPRVAIQQDIGDGMIRNQPGHSGGPVVRRAAKRNVARCAEPERPVARVEPDPPDLCARRPQHLGQPMEEWPVRSLQEQKMARRRGGHGPAGSFG